MNQPDRYDKFVVPAHLSKVRYIPNTKDARGATFEIQREDHTVGDPLVQALLEDKHDLLSAGMSIPHPLEYRMHIKLWVKGAKKQSEVYNDACTRLQVEVQSIKAQLMHQVEEALKEEADFEPHTRLSQPVREEEEYFGGDGGAYGAGAYGAAPMEEGDAYGAQGGFGVQDAGAYGAQDGGGFGAQDGGAYGSAAGGGFGAGGAYGAQHAGAYGAQDSGAYGAQDSGAYGAQDAGAYGAQDQGYGAGGGY